MSNPFLDYYTNQAGSGLAHFQGYRYQRGNGFFGSLFQNILKPLGLYLGKQALTTGVNIGQDILKGEEFKPLIKKNARNALSSILRDGSERVKQKGSGRKRRRTVRKKKKCLVPSTIKRKTKKKKSVKRKKSKRTVVNKFSHIF